MSKRKKYNVPFFNFKETMLHLDMENNDFYTIDGNKINISELTMKKFEGQIIVSKNCSQKITHTDVIHKRRFDEDNVDQIFKFDKSYTENKWKQFKKIKSYDVKNYSSIPFISILLPSLLKNENSPYNSNLHDVKTHSNVNLPISIASDSKGNKIKKSTVVQGVSALRDHKKKHTNENHIEKASLYKKESMTFSGCVVPKGDLSHHSTSSNNDLENHCNIDSIYFSTKMKDNEDFVTEDVNFTTAAGNSIMISSAAMLKAHKLCETEPVLCEKITSDSVKINEPKKNNYPSLEKNPSSAIPKFSENKNLQTFSSYKNEENKTKKSAACHSSSIENLEIDDAEDVGFCNAAGKTITVSNIAIETAKKLIYNGVNEEKASLQNENVSIKKNQFHKDKISNNSPNSTSDDVDMDSTLVENFFEDVHFDEKELELAGGNIIKGSLNTVLISKKDESLPAHKRRKSLGGRRSMRDCSNIL